MSHQDNQTKYQYDSDFQQEILQFTVTDLKYGHKAIPLFESHYFTLVEHIVLAEALKRYYAKKFIVPSAPVLKEEVRQMLRTKAWESQVDPKEKENIFKIIKRIYLRPVKDAEGIYESCKMYARYSAFKTTLEDINLEDFSSYEQYHKNVYKAVNTGTELTEDLGMFFLADARSRLIRRADSPPGHPTPWWQLNALMNNGGTSIGMVIVVMGEEKKFKTGWMLNTALGYLKRGKVYLYADFENGENSLGLRLDQAVSNTDRKGTLETKNNKKLLKLIRQYRRFGGELIVRRFNAGQTAADIEAYAKMVYETKGIKIQGLFCDYPDIMGAINGEKTEDKRISQVYLDLKNLANNLELEAVYCPSHITREAAKTNNKKKKSTDASKAQDKARHADMTLSIEQDDIEREVGIIRIEVVSQRDGPQDGRCYYYANLAKQKIKELNKAQVEEINDLRAEEGQVESREPKEDEEKIKKKQKKLSDV